MQRELEVQRMQAFKFVERDVKVERWAIRLARNLQRYSVI
jgi:hypothetical protein